MPDNLSISIGVDASKAGVQIELLKAKLRDLNSEARKLATQSQRGGEILPRLPEVIAEIDQTKTALRGLTVATRETTVAGEQAGMSFAAAAKQMAAFAKVSGVAVGGMKALRFGIHGFIASQVIRGLEAITGAINEIQDLSKKTGLDPATIKQFGDAVAETGGKAEDAAGMLSKLTEPFAAEKKAEMTSWWGAANDAAAAGLQPASAYAKALNELHINMQQFGTDAKGQRELVIAVAKSLADLAAAGKLNDANRLSTELLGKNWREAGEALQRYIELSKTPADAASIVSPEAAANAKLYTIAVNSLTTAWNELLGQLAKSGVFEEIINFVKDLTVGLKVSTEQVKTLLAFLQQVGEALGVLEQHDFGGGGDFAAQAPIPGAAGGGYVRGPGTATSDSILARVSNGEFVMRTAAVRKWGVGFMAALNGMRNPFGYAGGGLVPRFARGGMVTARTSDGATINLHFPGGSFAMRGDNAIVAGLTREAQRAGMLAGGRKAGLLQ